MFAVVDVDASPFALIVISAFFIGVMIGNDTGLQFADILKLAAFGFAFGKII